MKIAVTTNGTDLNSQLVPNFGRGMYFVILNTKTKNFEIHENENSNLGNIAAVKSAEFLKAKGAEVVIADNCEPKAVKLFQHVGIEIHNGIKGSIENVFKQYS